MTETDISKVLIEGEYATIMGVKYKRVEEPKPRMEYQQSGTVDKVEYNGHTYLRIDYDNDGWFGGVWWKQIERHKSPMNIVTDSETRNILEGLWFNQVKKDEPTKPMEEVMDRLENKWNSAAENSASYITDDVVNRLIEKYQAQKLYKRLFEVGYGSEDCEMILSVVEDWLPKPQNAAGSQNVDTELLVDGFNHCLQKMKEMLR
jgi:hypothetical protein